MKYLHRRRWFLSASLMGLITACGLSTRDRSNSGGATTQPAIALPPQNSLPTYEQHETARSTLHVVRVPAQGPWQVVPRVADGLLPLPEFAGAWDGEVGAIALINAGFFDPANQLTTSAIIRDGLLVADPRQNPRLMENPDLTPYLDRILDRSEFRRLSCEAGMQYQVARPQQGVPGNCQIVHSLAAGPQLLPTLELEAEGFRAVVNGQVVRDALGSDRPNARSAVGLTAAGDVLLVMAAQRPEAPQNSGLTLPELAQFMASQGAVQALNLDGGSSSGLFFEGNAMYGRVNAEGQLVQRPIKSVLAVIPASL